MTRAQGSYIAEEDFGCIDTEIARLGAQIALSWPREREVVARLPVPQDGALLDIGCGPGFLLERLGEMYPQAHLTGIDPSPTLLKSAAARLAGRFGDRLSLHEGGFGYGSLAGGAFDLAMCRYVLQHMADPLQALTEVHAALRPGGYAAIVEVDAGLIGLSEPFDPSLAEIYRRAGKVQTGRGGNRTVARRLVRLMQAAGFDAVRLDALVLHSDEYGRAPFDHQISPETLRPALEEGAISPFDYARLQNATQAFQSDPASMVLSLVFICTGQHPPE